MALPFYNWSKTAASNASADSTVNWAEGQAPSSVNDSARAMMASTAAFRDDIAGAIVTGGTSNAYTVASFQVFDTLAHLNGQVIAFTPHTTCGSTVTLNVDSLGAKPLRSAPSIELPAGTLVQGTPYLALYNNSDGAFYLQGFFSNPYQIPIGASVDFWGTSAPNSSFALMYGQAVSRTTYSSLFSLLGTTFGTGDGSTTFNIPDLRGRIVAGKDDMGGSAAGRLTTILTGTTLGYTAGTETVTLTASQIPTINSSGTMTVTSSQGNIPYNTSNSGNTGSGGSFNGPYFAGSISIGTITSTGSNTMASTNTGGTAHSNMPPTIIGNKLIRLI